MELPLSTVYINKPTLPQRLIIWKGFGEAASMAPMIPWVRGCSTPALGNPASGFLGGNLNRMLARDKIYVIAEQGNQQAHLKSNLATTAINPSSCGASPVPSHNATPLSLCCCKKRNVIEQSRRSHYIHRLPRGKVWIKTIPPSVFPAHFRVGQYLLFLQQYPPPASPKKARPNPSPKARAPVVKLNK